MNTLSILIYLAGVAGTMGSFLVFVAVVFGALTLGSLIAFVVNLDETDQYGRIFPESKLTSQRENRSKAWRWMWAFLVLMISTGILATAVPSRQTVLLIAASQMGEQVLNHPRINQVVDPGIDLLTTWMQKETADLRRSSEPNNRAR
jgi:hypothetical protein